MSKKSKIFFFKKNPLELSFLDFINNLIIEDFLLLNSKNEIYYPQELLFLKSETALTNKKHSFFIDDNKIGENILGIYTKFGDKLNWNKEEGSFINLDADSTYEIRGNTLKMELVDRNGLWFNLEEENLSIFMIVSYD